MKYTPDFSSRFRILKGGKISLVVSALLAGSTMSFAAPSGGSVTSGSATINQNGSITTINQSTNKASINWQDFSIGKTETVNFVQPSAQSVTLNRVVGTTQSLIEGAMNANGQVFLLNPNGVLFANGSQINVGGLVASTLNITDANFQAGNYTFEGNSQNSIINMGTIAANNGYVAMMGKHVANEGTIVATMGNVQLASGEKISLNLNGNSLVKLTIDQGTMDALVENKGLIKADGGQVYLTTQALNTILDGMVNNTGIIEAQSLNNVDGKVVLFAHGGTTNVAGTLSTGSGKGFIETSGEKVNIKDGVNAKTAQWLIDPEDFIIRATGGNISGSTLSTLLGSNSITIQTGTGTDTSTSKFGTVGTNGDIFVEDAITWSANTTLTLNAHRNIYISDNITSSGATGKVALYYGQGAVAANNTADYVIASGKSISLHEGINFETKLGSDGTRFIYSVITALGSAGDENIGNGETLQGIAGMNLNVYYVLGANIDASVTSTWNGGMGFAPLGDSSTTLYGSFIGLGHTISNLTINRPTTDDVALFGGIDATTVIRDLGLVNVSITGQNRVGGVIGTNYGVLKNVYVTGSVTGTGYEVGGLVGNNFLGTISQSYAASNVTGTSRVGGLVGINWGVYNASIATSYATGSVSGTETVGGLVCDQIGLIPIDNNYWDTQTTGQSTSEGGTGKTTAEMKTLSTFSGWDISTSGLNTTWKLDSGAYPTLSNRHISPLSVAAALTPTPLARPVEHYDITTIVNSTAVTPPILRVIAPVAPQPQQIQTQVQNNALLQTIVPESTTSDGTFNLVGSTNGVAPVQTVSMDQLQSAALTQGVGEIRVPLGNGSVVDLINGGVTLPKGVSQEFYVVATNRT
ncbi:MAG: hypothetical protein CJD30_09765, partial [Sulfuricurvum sp. PD_MW2]|uniref:two-partner secretion domain-containing protein n=1 Tax=Sulfuricurvum sp. PD_MW2 TaxID=2027917 RepID=UPI000C062072